MQNARIFLERLLIKGKLEAAIEASLILCRHYGDTQRMGAVAQHSARFHALMDEQTAGTLDEDDYRPERARINRDMFELIQDLPSNWTDEALAAEGFSADAFEQTFVPNQKSNLGKNGIIIGLVVLLVALLGLVLKDKIFPPDGDPKIGQPEQTKPVKPETATSDSADKEAAAVETKPQSPVQKRPSSPMPPQGDKEPMPSDNKFRSFGKSKIIEDMELGYVGQKLAFRNVRTLEILCCFADAKDFKGGKAYVSKDGVKYFYVDKQGNEVK